MAWRPVSLGKSIPSFLPAGLKSKTQFSVSADARESASQWSRPKAYRCNVSAISYRSQASWARSVLTRCSLSCQYRNRKETKPRRSKHPTLRFHIARPIADMIGSSRDKMNQQGHYDGRYQSKTGINYRVLSAGALCGFGVRNARECDHRVKGQINA